MAPCGCCRPARALQGLQRGWPSLRDRPRAREGSEGAPCSAGQLPGSARSGTARVTALADEEGELREGGRAAALACARGVRDQLGFEDGRDLVEEARGRDEHLMYICVYVRNQTAEMTTYEICICICICMRNQTAGMSTLYIYV